MSVTTRGRDRFLAVQERYRFHNATALGLTSGVLIISIKGGTSIRLLHFSAKGRNMGLAVGSVTRPSIHDNARVTCQVFNVIHRLRNLHVSKDASMSVRETIFLARVMRYFSVEDPGQFAIFSSRDNRLTMLQFFSQDVRPSIANGKQCIVFAPMILMAFLVLVRRHSLLVSKSTLRERKQGRHQTPSLR